MSTEISLPTGSYVTNDPRGSSKRLVGCFSEALDKTAPTDSKSKIPPVMLRRAPGIAAFGSVAAAVAAVVAQITAISNGITAGIPATQTVLGVTAGGKVVNTTLATVGVASYKPEPTVAALTATVTQQLTTAGSSNNGDPNAGYDGCFGYYDGSTGQDFSACGAVGVTGLGTAGATNYLGTYASAVAPSTHTPSITAAALTGPASCSIVPGVYNPEGEVFYYGYLSEFAGSITGASGIVSGYTVTEAYLDPQESSFNLQIVNGGGAQPGKSAFTTISWADVNGTHTLDSSAASYSAGGWTWAYDDTIGSGTFDNPTVFTFTGTNTGLTGTGYDSGSSGTGPGFAAGGSTAGSAPYGTIVAAETYSGRFVLAIYNSGGAPAKTSFYSVEPGNVPGVSVLAADATYSTAGGGTIGIWSWSWGVTYTAGDGYTLTFTDVVSSYDQYFRLQLTSAGGAPAQDVFTALSWTDINGSHDIASSAATYSTSGNTATWQWSYSYGAYSTTPFSGAYATPTFSFTGVFSAIGYNASTSGLGLSTGGSIADSLVGTLGTVVGIVYSYNPATGNWDFHVAINGGAVAPAQTSLTSIYDGTRSTFLTNTGCSYTTALVGSDYIAYYHWGGNSTDPYTGGDEYTTVCSIVGAPTGFDDGTNAGDEELPAIGSVGTTTIGSNLTLNGAYYYYNAVTNETYFDIVATGVVQAKQSDLISVQVNGGTVLAASSAYAFGNYGYAGIWTWAIGSGDVIPITTGGAPYDLDFNVQVNYAGYDDGTAAGGDSLPAIGSITGSPVTFGDDSDVVINSVAYYYNPSTSVNFIQVIATGSTVTPAQNAFASITFTDVHGIPQQYNSDYATYTKPSGKVAVWTWVTSSGLLKLGFGVGDTYPVTVLLTSQPWVGYDDGTKPNGSGSSFGSFSGTLPAAWGADGAMNALEYTAFPGIGLNNSATVNTKLIMIATGTGAPPAQYSFTGVSFTANSGLTVSLPTSSAAYSSDGVSVSTWIWSISQGAANLGFTKGDSYAFVFLLPAFAGYDDGTGASGSGFSAMGGGPGSTPDDHLPVAPFALGTLNAIEVTAVPLGSGWKNTLLVAITPDTDEYVDSFGSDILTSVAFTDASGTQQVFKASDAAFSLNGAGTVGIWQWILGTPPSAAPNQLFQNGLQYSISLQFGGAAAQDSVRGMHQMQGVLYAVVGPTLYTVDESGEFEQLASGVPGKLATGIAGTGFVRMADNTNCLVILVPNTNLAWTYCPGDTSGAPFFQQLSNAGFTQYGALDVWYDQTYFCFLMQNGRGFFNDDGLSASGTGQITFANGNVFGRENGTDLLVGGCVDHLEVMCFGTLTSEGFLNAGVSPGDPFQAAPSSFIELGSDPDAGYSIAKQDQTIFWVANDRTVRRRVGQTPERVSNSGIEAILEDADLTGCYALTPTVAGHPMWVLTMPAEGRTIAYDCLTLQWWEPYSLQGEGFWRPLCYANAYGKQLVGDFYSAQVGALDTKTFTEFGIPLFSEFTTQAVYDDNNRFTTRRVELIVTTGYVITPETTPSITLYISDDSGATYYAREMDSLGLQGQRTIRCVWFNMGQSRCRVFKWRVSGATPTFAVQATGVFEGGRW